MTFAWSSPTVTVGPAVLAFVTNTLAQVAGEDPPRRMAGPISDRFIDWFRAGFPRAGAVRSSARSRPRPLKRLPPRRRSRSGTTPRAARGEGRLRQVTFAGCTPPGNRDP
jgi:hypothetical protein